MVRTNALSKSVWAQLGRGTTKGRDTEDSGAPTRVSEDAQARTVDQHAARLFDFAPQKRDQLPERPSTSAGPASNFAKRRNAEKRETKDDLHFNPLAVHGVGTTFYNFPLPGFLPTPASSPKSAHHPASSKLQETRPSTPESMEMAPMKEDIPQAEIGMALGSPLHPPTAWTPIPSDRYTESPDHVDDDFSNPTPVKQKTSKWKLLGGLFGGKKNEAQSTAFYQVQPESSPQAPLDHGFVFGNASDNPKPRGRGRSISIARKAGKQKPDMGRSNTVPLRFDFNGSSKANPTGNPEITIDGGSVAYDGPRSTQKGAGLLDVDIPSIQMERYSIMFGSLLQPQAQSQSSSLLTRRQATLDKLKTVNEAIASKEGELEAKSKLLLPRRATSPGFKTQSPGFSLFPNTPTSRARDASPSNARPSLSLQRSNTSPAALSPSRPSFAPGASNEDHAYLVSGDSPTVPFRQHPDMHRGPRARRKEEPKAVPELALETNKWSQDQSHLDSSSDSESPILTTIPLKPRLTEPIWQMANSPHAGNDSVSGSSTSGSDHSTSTSASSITTPLSASTAPYPVMKPVHINSPPQTRTRAATVNQAPPKTRSRSATTGTAPSSIPRSNIASAMSSSLADPKSEDEARLESAADVSIARQISISRQQRELLVSTKTVLNSSLKNSPVPSPSPVTRTNTAPSIVSPSKKIPTPTNPNGSPKKDRVVGAQNFPSPASGIGKVASPLGAIATATQEERERGERGRASPQLYHQQQQQMSPSGSGKDSMSSPGRLVQVAKPSTPTLVVVGGGGDEREKAWVNANTNNSNMRTEQSQAQSQTPVGFSERSKMKESSLSQTHVHQSSNSTASSLTGEIRVGLAVPRENSQASGVTLGSVKRAREMAMSNRKSERVIVERMSVVSS
ncbi:hypothetical protein VTL71DRAFT_3138 [Oculimacula yallundae]|uniref:Uncharacterized protein n=1 Tax=Oculimacula yallundae TaxID=86028 RepID=A0ABR4C8H5_9HELO